MVLVEQIRTVLDEYREHLPMTARQIFTGWWAATTTPAVTDADTMQAARDRSAAERSAILAALGRLGRHRR